MKKVVMMICLLACQVRLWAQAEELEQLALNVEKLAQFKQILSDLKKSYDILYAGYSHIKDLAESNFNLHDAFLDGLLQVSPAVKKYRRIVEIIHLQLALVKEYKSTFNRFRNQGFFTVRELEYMGRIYGRLFTQSLDHLSSLADVLTAHQLRMSDDERLSAIDQIYQQVRNKLNFLRQFNHSTSILGIQRQKEQTDVQVMRQLQGIQK